MENREYAIQKVFFKDQSKYDGLEKREYYASIALQGILSSGEYKDNKSAVKESIEIADELIKQLNSHE